MKFLIKTLPFFLLLAFTLQQTLPQCLIEQGCIANITNIEGFLPISTQNSLTYRKSVSLLLFADKLVFSFDNQQIKSFSYAEINLDCGPVNNKLCSQHDFQAKFPDQFLAKSVFIHNFCFVLPSIFSQKASYLCENKASFQLDFLERMNTLSRLIDNFQIRMMKEKENLMNNYPRKEHNFFFLDNNKRLVLPKIKIFFHSIQGFLGENLLFEWEIKTINPFREIATVSDAIKYKYLTEKQLKPLEKVLNLSHSVKSADCLVIFIRNEPKFLCSKAKSSLQNVKETISGYLNRMKYLKDFDLLSTIQKTHNNSIVFSPYLRDFNTMRLRIMKLEEYDTMFCTKNKLKVNEKHCQEAKNRDIKDEMYFLAQNSENILDGLSKVKRNRVFKLPQKTLSFLQIKQHLMEGSMEEPSADNLKKSEVFKKKIMEKLQGKNKKWMISVDERSKGDFRKRTDSDPFVTYLGFIRDSLMSTYKAQELKVLKE